MTKVKQVETWMRISIGPNGRMTEKQRDLKHMGQRVIGSLKVG